MLNFSDNAVAFYNNVADVSSVGLPRKTIINRNKKFSIGFPI